MSREIRAIILASGSAARKAMLTQAGVKFWVVPSKIDENTYRADNAEDLASMLAQEKALDVSRKNPQALVIGSDQTLEFNGQIFSKAKTAEEAVRKLEEMSGQAHTLYSAVSIALDGKILWSYQDRAYLTMHTLEKSFIEVYARKEEDALFNCVGGYKIEGTGAWLFSKIEGDVFTIMGMPLLALLGYLREEHGFTP